MFRPVKTAAKLCKTVRNGRESGLHLIGNVLLLEYQTNSYGSLLLQIQNKYKFFKKERDFSAFFSTSNAGREMIIIFMGLQSL